MASRNLIAVRERARERCEYCRMHEALQGATFHVEHVLPRIQGGGDELDNLAFACPSCNLHKAERTRCRDPETNLEVDLFNPRIHLWDDHFQFEGYELRARSPIGRATIQLLNLNHSRRYQIRRAEEMFGLFPP
jgi:hypothetical protein